jgi:hypothetical protein
MMKIRQIPLLMVLIDRSFLFKNQHGQNDATEKGYAATMTAKHRVEPAVLDWYRV